MIAYTEKIFLSISGKAGHDSCCGRALFVPKKSQTVFFSLYNQDQGVLNLNAICKLFFLTAKTFKYLSKFLNIMI